MHRGLEQRASDSPRRHHGLINGDICLCLKLYEWTESIKGKSTDQYTNSHLQ